LEPSDKVEVAEHGVHTPPLVAARLAYVGEVLDVNVKYVHKVP
jgi:hypothetical protein